jgi:superfamily II DNA or RNA helicase
MSERRQFNDRERAALYVVADGRCSECGTELEPGWHSDHQTPHSRDGKTDVINGQALCPPCNLKKGATMANGPRSWQTAALERYAAHRSNDFLVTATPGSGKTRFALSAARELLDNGTVSRIIVVCPTSHLRRQWKDAAHEHYGIQLDPTFVNKTGALAGDVHGPVVTYGAVKEAPLVYRKLAHDRPTLVILDEVHHAGESRSWGEALRSAFEPAVRRLLLSGTPFRSDDNPIPFVAYVPDELGIPRSRADYSYGYGRALNDGVVRPIAFNALDGQARWRDAGVVVEGSLNNADEDQAKRALSTALEPDGAWIGSVLRSADDELTRVRESVPDAGGLVVARNQYVARAYGERLQRICGEPVTVAISDEPDASDLISRFAEGRSRWLVAVQMVSEGVDIPRLAVGVYASNITTRMFFRQVVGRFVRTRGEDDELCAALFLPSIPSLLAHGQEIEQERDHALHEEIEKAQRDRDSDRSMTLELNLVEPLDSSEAVHHATILSGESFADAELTRALNFAQQAGLPNNVQPAQVARLLRLAGAGSEPVGRVTVPAATPSVTDQKAPLRKLVNKKVAQYSRATDVPHSHVHQQLNNALGDTVPKATIETLNKRLAVLDEWLAAL